MPKTQRLEHGERRRCLVAPRRASSRQTRHSVLGRRRVLPVGAHSLTQILYAGGPKPWHGPDRVHGGIVAPDTAVSGMIMCGTGSPLADGSGAKALARGCELDLACRGAWTEPDADVADIRKSSYAPPPAANNPIKPSSSGKNGGLDRQRRVPV